MPVSMSIPTLAQRHIVLAIGYGIVVLLWLTPEDNTVLIVSLLGAGLSFVVQTLAILRWAGGRQLSANQAAWGWIGFGVTVGFGAVWASMFLMVFKNAWHSHAAPDFASDVVWQMADRVVWWSLAGGLLGAAIALWRR